MASDLIVADGQVQLRGLLMGDGTPYSVESFNPFVFPELSGVELGRPQRHGVVAGRDLFRARRIPLRVNILVDSAVDAVAARHALAAAFAPSYTDLWMGFRVAGVTYEVAGRPRLADPADLDLLGQGAVPLECRFLATDPLLYAAVEQHQSSGFPEPSDLYYDPYEDAYLDPLTDGRLLFTNAGTAGAPWIIEVVGPWVDPHLQLFDPDPDYPPVRAEIRFDGLTLADGEVLRVDSRIEAITVDGAARPDLVTPATDWFTVPPGSWALRVTGDSGSGSADAWMRSVWL